MKFHLFNRNVVYCKPFLLLAVTLVILISLTTQSPRAELSLTAKSSVNAVLPFTASINDVPAIHSALRDPAVEKTSPKDDADIAWTEEEIKNLVKGLKGIKGKSNISTRIDIYRMATGLAYYLEDVAEGEVASSISITKAKKKLSLARQIAMTHASYVAKRSKNKSAVATAQFHYAYHQYFSGSQAAAIKKFENIPLKSVNGYLSRRIKAVLAYSGLRKNDREEVQQMAKLTPSLNRSGGVLARLEIARVLAGVSTKGTKFAKTDKSYRKYVWAALNRATSFEKKKKERVLSYALAIWRRAEAADLSEPPLAVNKFMDFALVHSAIEKTALADLSAGKTQSAIKKYRMLSAKYEGQLKKKQLDERILDLYHRDYLSSKSPNKLEKALRGMEQNYLDPLVLGSANTAKVELMRKSVLRRYENLVSQEIAAAMHGKSPKTYQRTIALARRYIDSTDDLKEKERTKASVAAIFVKYDQHRDAVKIYSALAENSVLNKQDVYLRKAITSQHEVAKWPTKQLWTLLARAKIEGSRSEDRRQLLTLMQRFDGANKAKVNWKSITSRGLLHLSLDEKEQAIRLWQSQLEVDTKGLDARQAAGYMVNQFDVEKRWEELEKWASFSRSHKIAAGYLGKNLDLYQLEAKALIEQGHLALASKDYALAVKKFERFVKFKKAKRLDDGSYHLALAYQGVGKHEKAIKVLTAFSQDFPKSKFLRPALLRGGDSATLMAFEENVMYFYRTFLEKFPKDEQANRVSQSLFALYEGRQMYGYMVGLLKADMLDTGKNSPERTELESQVMDVEYRFGSKKRAVQLAEVLRQNKHLHDAGKAQAYRILFEDASSKNSRKKLQSLLSDAERLGSADQTIRDALGYGLLLAAGDSTEGLEKEVFNLELRDPYKTLVDRYGHYKRIHDAHKRVCEIGSNAYCGPALSRLGELSQRFLNSIDEIEIQPTLAKAEVERFEKEKQKIFNLVTRISQDADDRSLLMVKSQDTPPHLTREVLWQSGTDWNFDSLSTDTGNSYIQWTSEGAAE